MRTKTILATLGVFLGGIALCLAADAQMGTWKLNEGKSKLAPGMGKNSMVVYAAAGDGVKVTVDGTDKDGKAQHNVWVGKFDGKDYAVTGDPSSDMRSYTKVDDHTLDISSKKGGKVMMSARVVVSADGKTRTITVSGTDANGKAVSSTGVYDKQ